MRFSFRTSALLASATSLASCAPRIDPTKLEFPPPQTRAEASGYNQTSSYGDVIAFINGLRSRNAPLSYGSIGKTTEGRDIPYLIASRPIVNTPEEARRLGRPIVYVNANIHAGEVEGKEAILALVRDLVQQRRPNVLDSLVLIAVPIYNADGNERFAPQAKNRTEQNGPELVGQRPNAQGLDLNRDYVKAEAPETRASLAMFNAWDPDVYVDLHTTDGSFHGYALTYSPSLNPTSYAPGFPGALTRDTILPEIRARMHQRGIEIFDYGNFEGGPRGRAELTDTVKHGWYTYEHTPRYGTNYYGMRGRVSILSEAFSHDPFKRRVATTYAFVSEILSATARHAASIEAIRAASNDVDEPRVPIRSKITDHPFEMAIPFEVLKATGDSTRTQAGVPLGIRRTGRYISQVMPVYVTFDPTMFIEKPAAYWVPAADTAPLRLLREHGLVLTQANGATGYRASEFVVDSVAKSARPFQGHTETHLTGRWRDATLPADEGYIVSARGRLGPLTAYLLEPQSDDGLVDWNFFDPMLASGRAYSVLRLYQ